MDTDWQQGEQEANQELNKGRQNTEIMGNMYQNETPTQDSEEQDWDRDTDVFHTRKKSQVWVSK